MGFRVNPYPVDTIHGAFVAAANAHPDAIAVLGNDDDGTPNLSFRQLGNLCRSLAAHLTRTSSSTHARCGPAIFRTGDPSPGIAVGASVAVSLDSSIELIVAYFAVLMAGKAFAPLETTLPPAALTGVLSALHEHANLTHHIVSATGGDTGEPDHPIPPGTRTLAIRLSKPKSHPGDDSSADAEPRLEVHESGVPVTVIRCTDTSSDDSDEMDDDETLNTTHSGGPDDVAHVIHTGGSTGAPKAVVCAHRGSLASHAARAATHPYVADDVTGVCVFGVWDAVCALLAGSKVAMLPPESITNGGDVLGRYLCDNKVTRTMLTPSLAELLVAAAAQADSVHAREALDAMRVVVLCGETPRVGLVDALLSSQADETDEEYSKSRVVANLYSVSEAHDVALERNLRDVQEGLTSTCGVPYGHVHLAIADDDGCVLAESESEGWLHIAGDGVASGYLGPHGWEATRRAFVSRTWLDGVTRTWYATGDRAKVRKDGRLVLLGRGAGAGRVKIRGKLVDVDGVEEVLRGYPGVKACACVARPLSHLNSGDDTPREALVAFVVPKKRRIDEADEALSVEDTEAEAIDAYLADRLPRWSVPARVVFVASIPLTAALASSAPKCDRRALARMPLPSPRRTRARRDGEGREVEREEVDGRVVAHVAKLAADVLGVDASSVDGDDSFAQLGGASLEAQRLLYVLRSAPTSSMGTLNYVGRWDRMTPADIIAADTPRRMAAAAMNGSPSDGTGGALTTAGMFAEAAREAKGIGVGMWDARGVWNPLEASGSDEVVKGVKPSETVLSLGRASGVFLTGATGLLGRCLMHEILARMAPDAALFCLVRGASAGTARARLEEKAFPSKTLDSRVRVIAGDAAHRKFGLSDEEHAGLAESIDVVVHSAGVVSAAAPYASMASGNVAPAREVLRLACLRPGAIVVHHVSSSAVLPPLGTPAAEVADSCATWSESATGGGEALASLAAAGGYDTAEVHGGTWQGYAQAKWVTEMLVWATAKSCGVPVCVYRPGNIGPRSFDGVGCEGDGTMALALATCVGGWTSDMRIGERWRLWWTPADAVARAIATVAAIENGDVWANRALHVDPVEPLPASALMNRMKVRMNAGVWKRLEASGSDDDGREGGGDGDDDDDVSAWRRAVLAGLHALPPTLRRKVESLLALKSGLVGAMGAAERRMDGTELRAMLQTEENGDLFMDACEEVLGRYVDAFAEHVEGQR